MFHAKLYLAILAVRIIAIFILLAATSSTFAISIDTQNFTSSEHATRYQKLINEIRCPVCQGQSIAGSNALLAKDLRAQVTLMIKENKSNEDIKKFMRTRYGDFVVFKPPVIKSTLILWFAPFIFILLAVWFLFYRLRKNKCQISSDKNNINIEELNKLLH